MKQLNLDFTLAFILVCALSLTVILKEPLPVDAKGLSKVLFTSPIPDEDDDGPPPRETRGEVDPGQGGENMPVRDPETGGFSVIFPKGSIDTPVQIKIFNSGLPQRVPAFPNKAASRPNSIVPIGMNSAYFFFGAWMTVGEGGAIRQFNRSVLINVPYEALDLSSAQEERLRIWMYDPAIQAWIKLGSRVDIFNNVVTGILASTTPYETNGNTLFALGIDHTPDLQQSVDEFGKTTLSINGRNNFRFHLLPGTVEVSTHFEVTSLDHIPTTHSVQLLTEPVDIKAYLINHHQDDYSDDHQITAFPNPLQVEFTDNPVTLARAGRAIKLTIVTLQNGQWVDVEGLGYKVTRNSNKVAVNTDKLGTFSLAIKP